MHLHRISCVFNIAAPVYYDLLLQVQPVEVISLPCFGDPVEPARCLKWLLNPSSPRNTPAMSRDTPHLSGGLCWRSICIL